MQEIRSAVDERLFYVWKSLHYEKLKGNRSHERSMRLNSQFRLILQIDKPTPRPGQLPPPHVVVVVKIEDYH
jgi:proteic killer suppression protein